MNNSNILKIYSGQYAQTYNERFLLNPWSKIINDYQLTLLKKLITKDTLWLDVACGTGYALSQFPDVERAGFDISTDMLNKAQSENPSAILFKQGDFRNNYSDLENKWSIVSCMWGAYCYVETVKEARIVILNLISWIKKGGTLFLPVLDIYDIRPKSNVSYIEPVEVYGGFTKVTSCTWSWIEEGNEIEHFLMSIPLEYIIEIIKPYFEVIEIKRFRPHESKNPERVIVARGKKEIPDSQPAEIIWGTIDGVQIENNKYTVQNSNYNTSQNISIINRIKNRLKRLL